MRAEMAARSAVREKREGQVRGIVKGGRVAVGQDRER